MEYPELAGYGGDILVEHDVTFGLFGQIARREPTPAILNRLLHHSTTINIRGESYRLKDRRLGL